MGNGSVMVPYASIQKAFEEDPAAVHETVYDSANEAAGGDASERGRLIAKWHDALAAIENGDKGRAVLSTPQDGLASRLQTLLAEQSVNTGRVEVVQPTQTVTTQGGTSTVREGVQVKFDNADLIGWLGTGLKIIFARPEPHAWMPPPAEPQTIADDARVAVFGDWGTGLYGAPVIAKSIAKLDRCDVVLHLGDTYYSGGDDEIKKRLIGDWPARAGAVNRALNGNHEMYSGGRGYFQALASFFKQPASCFALQNSSWILVGLDTSYKDFDLDGPQVAWLNAVAAKAGARKLVLFSHHQLFSQRDDQGPKLQHAVAELLDANRIHAWFWGHEHRLVLYEPHRLWGLKGRCVGHGGFPAFRDTDIGAGGDVYQWIQLSEKPHAPGAKLFDGPNFWVVDNPAQYSPNGYLVLDFDGDSAWETYRTPDNIGISERMRL